MSIVERAIKKLQESQPQRGARPAPAVGSAPVDGAAAPAAAVEAFEETGSTPVAPARVIPFNLDRLRAHRLMPPVEQEQQLSAQYRHIKRPLVTRALGRDGQRSPRANAMIVTSALPGEGKSFTAVNLALSMALEQGVNVLLVDADVGRPRLTREFGLERDKGLLDVLVDDTLDVESLIIGTDVPSLSLLPSGTLSGTATELLASARMDAVVEQLCSRNANRIIVFDSPPLLPTTEARVLAQDMGQVVMIIREAATPQQAVMEALDLLGDRDHVYLVLTQSHVEGAGSYYYGSYGDEANA